jgi:hypothetical protein
MKRGAGETTRTKLERLNDANYARYIAWLVLRGRIDIVKREPAPLSADRERHIARLVADFLAGRHVSNTTAGHKAAGILIASFGKDIPRFLRLVIKAAEGKRTKFDLTPTGENILKAWDAAWHKAIRRTGKRPNLWAVPTLVEIKVHYALACGMKPPADQPKKRKWIADLERDKRMPADQTFRKTLKRQNRPFR